MVDLTIENELGVLLQERGLTLAVAESCTGGLLGHRITMVDGSSGYFVGGVIAYSNEIKTGLLSVDPQILDCKGAVSEEVASAMAEGVRLRMGADIGLATTGIAGPGGGTEEKPVGLVYAALARSGEIIARRLEFGGKNRLEIKELSSQEALRMAVDFLQGEKDGKKSSK